MGSKSRAGFAACQNGTTSGEQGRLSVSGCTGNDGVPPGYDWVTIRESFLTNNRLVLVGLLKELLCKKNGISSRIAMDRLEELIARLYHEIVVLSWRARRNKVNPRALQREDVERVFNCLWDARELLREAQSRGSEWRIHRAVRYVRSAKQLVRQAGRR